jgi:uncharacterized protein YabN with tetrapyrrole methylase and pyrophosphatase domain
MQTGIRSMELLEKVGRLEKEADDFGFRWERPDQIMAQIESECLEIREHLQSQEMNTSALQEEIGDLLHAVFSLCVFCQFSPEETLKNTLEKFEKRLNAVKHLAKEQGLTSLEGFPFDELMVLWDQAKELTR